MFMTDGHTSIGITKKDGILRTEEGNLNLRKGTSTIMERSKNENVNR